MCVHISVYDIIPDCVGLCTDVRGSPAPEDDQTSGGLPWNATGVCLRVHVRRNQGLHAVDRIVGMCVLVFAPSLTSAHVYL